MESPPALAESESDEALVGSPSLPEVPSDVVEGSEFGVVEAVGVGFADAVLVIKTTVLSPFESTLVLVRVTTIA